MPARPTLPAVPAVPAVPALPRRATVCGLTLVEVLVVMALLGILLALAAPSMREMIASQRVRSINAALVTDLGFARSEAVRRNTDVIVKFGGDAAQTCYVVYVGGVSGFCNCTLMPPNPVCSTGFIELRTVRVERALEVALAASSSMAQDVRFSSRSSRAAPSDFAAEVRSTVRGQLRTQLNGAGLPQVCSPDASIAQVPPCS